jgi:hypothetical protein
MNLEQAKENEAQVIYEMIKTCNGGDGSFNYPATLKGVKAAAIVNGQSIVLTYADGTVSTYTEQ